MEEGPCQSSHGGSQSHPYLFGCGLGGIVVLAIESTGLRIFYPVVGMFALKGVLTRDSGMRWTGIGLGTAAYGPGLLMVLLASMLSRFAKSDKERFRLFY